MRISRLPSTAVTSPLINLIDSNFLLRRVQPAHPLYPVATRAIRTLRGSGEIVYVCPQNFTEFWAVATRPVAARGLGMTIKRAERELARLEMLFPLLPDTPDIYPAWRRLVVGAGVSGKPTHDARIMAVAEVYGVSRLLTFNGSDFTRFGTLVPGVQIVDPQTL